MGNANCCKQRYDNEFFGPDNMQELLVVYWKELNTINKEIKNLEKDSVNLQTNMNLKFLQTFYLKVDDLTVKLQDKTFKNFKKIKELSHNLFSTLDNKNETQLKKALLDINLFIKSGDNAKNDSDTPKE